MRVARLFIFNCRIKGKSVEECEFRLQRKQNLLRVKGLPVIGGNCGVERGWDGAHLPPANRVRVDSKGTRASLPVLIE